MAKLRISGFLSEEQRQSLSNFPEFIDQSDVIKYFLLSDYDKAIVPVKSHAYTRLGFALSLCALRFLGFIPEDLSLAPKNAMTFVLRQINLDKIPNDFNNYGARTQTKTSHALLIERHLGFKAFKEKEQQTLKAWLLLQAMDHDRPILLLRAAIDKLKQERISRPTLVFLERLVSSVRELARKKTYELMSDIISEERKLLLDNLLNIDKSKGKTLLTWLKQRAVSSSPESICVTLEKVVFLENFGVHIWDLSKFSTNRLKLLSRLGQTSTNQALQRSVPERQYPILVAFMFQALEELVDEAIELFDQSISHAYSRAKNSLKAYQERIQESVNEKVRILKIIGSVILDENIADPEIRKELYEKIPLEKLQAAINDCNKLIRPENDKGLDYFANRFSYLRQYTPTFLSQIKFKSIQDNDPILNAIDILKEMNQTGTRKVPANAPINFINSSWQHYVFNNDKVERQYYELCTLWELRNSLRSGDIWVEGGRRYNNPEHYLIPKVLWEAMKDEACALLNIQVHGAKILSDRQSELRMLFTQLNSQIIDDPNLKIVDEQLVISHFDGEEAPESLRRLRQLISERLPKVGLTDMIMEVDNWVGLAECFFHAGNQTINKDEFPMYLYAAILSEGTNLGPAAVADASGLDYERIIWYKNWYIRDETILAARTNLINFQHEQILAGHFGDGTFSSSDGRRIPVAVKTRTAKAFVKYFAYETGLNFYSWTSDQYSQYGCKITSPTMREATLVLDAILDNETELNIERHTTDTAGYTEIIFALFDLLGLKFDPRIRNVGDQRIYYIGDKPDLANINELLNDGINTKLIEENLDDMLRLVASLKKGWVSASLFISKLQAMPRKGTLAKALQEYGKIPKTISILRYALSEQHRREITTQLNKGEAIHDLQQFLHLGREGRIYARQPGEQETHFGCLNLLINIVIVWNTVYMAEVIAQLQSEGIEISDDDIRHLSPARRGHINPYGNFKFEIDKTLLGKLRPLRNKA